MPPPCPSMRSTARWVLPVLVGPSTAVTVFWEGIQFGFAKSLGPRLGAHAPEGQGLLTRSEPPR